MTASSSTSAASDPYPVGARVRVIKPVAFQKQPLVTEVEGTVERFEQRKTGSWFAHSKDDRLWLDRLFLRKDDGEQVVFNLDPQTRVEVLHTPSDG